MNFVFISPQFPDQYRYFCMALRDAGAVVLGLGEPAYDEIHPELKDALTEYYRVDDMNDYDQLVRALGYFTHKHGRIDGLDSLNEHWLESEALLRTDFNVPGVKAADIDAIRHKSKMKALFRKARVPCIAGEVFQSEAGLRTFIEQHGYPIVAKPDAGVGARNTYKISDETQLKEFLAIDNPGDYILEEFIEGVITTFDGLTDADGDILFCTSLRYSNGVMETVLGDSHIQYYSQRTLPKKLERAGRRIVKAYNIRQRFFHLEFFHTADDRYIALEINMRPPGGFTTDMFNYACEIDIYQTWADMVVNGTSGLRYDRKYHCAYASRKNWIGYRNSHEDVLHRYGSYILKDVSMPEVFRGAMGDYAYIFRASEEAKIQEITDFIHNLS